MGAPNSKRIEVLEGNYTFTERRLNGIIAEIDMRLNGANVWVTFTRTGGLISKIEYFSNSARTIKVCEQNITRGAGVGSIQLVTGIQNIFYNSDTTEDSQVNETIGRPNLGTDDIIETCDSVFSTTEPPEC